MDMSELNGNEKYSYGVSLPQADQYYSSLAAGDYSYSRIGRLQSTDGLAAALGKGSVQVKFGKE